MNVYEVCGSIRDRDTSALVSFNTVLGYVTAPSEAEAKTAALKQEKFYQANLPKSLCSQIDFIQEMDDASIKQKIMQDIL